MAMEHNESSDDPSPLELEAYGWVVRFVSGEAGPDDINAFKAWASSSPDHAAAFDQASKVWKLADPTRRPLGIGGSVIQIPSSSTLTRDLSKTRGIGRRMFLGGAIAATAAGAAVLVRRPPLGLWPSWSELTSDYHTAPGEQRQITLADRVSIDLNTRSSLTLRPTSVGAPAVELVTGEAIIATSTGSTEAITVLAAGGRVIAETARFNVRYDDPSSVRVTCLKGLVEVEQDGAIVPLSINQQVVYSRRGIGTPVTIDPGQITAWKDGIVIFDQTPISEVVAEINRYRRGRVILTNDALGQQRLNARFKIANIDRVIEQIEQVFGARTQALPGGIILLG